MWIMYLIPVVAIAGMLVYVSMARSRIRQAVAEGKAPLMFHNSQSAYFDSLAPDEYIIAVWQGVAYTGSSSAAGQMASAVLNEVSARAVGISKYTPTIIVALTSQGRLLAAQEYSEFGQRGSYKEVLVWPAGARATTGPTAVSGHEGPPPKNPFNPGVTLELAALTGPDGSTFVSWLSPQSLEVSGQQRSIGRTLPMDPGQAAQLWHAANQLRPQM